MYIGGLLGRLIRSSFEVLFASVHIVAQQCSRSLVACSALCDFVGHTLASADCHRSA